LGNEKAPVEHGKAGVTTTQDGLEMVLESLDGTFSSIARATMDEDVVHLDIGSQDGGGFAVFDWFGSNAVAVVIIEDEQVVVALAGREGQLAGEITIALAGGGSINDCSEQVVGALAFL